MEIAREQEPGVGKEKESHGNNFNRKTATATQLVILLPSHQTVFSGASVQHQRGKTCPQDELPSSNDSSEEGAIRQCPTSPEQGECLWSCCHTTLVSRHALVRPRVGCCWTKRTLSQEAYPDRAASGAEQRPRGSTLGNSADFCNKPPLGTDLFSPQAFLEMKQVSCCCLRQSVQTPWQPSSTLHVKQRTRPFNKPRTTPARSHRTDSHR